MVLGIKPEGANVRMCECAKVRKWASQMHAKLRAVIAFAALLMLSSAQSLLLCALPRVKRSGHGWALVQQLCRGDGVECWAKRQEAY